jgi:hypothetical protein
MGDGGLTEERTTRGGVTTKKKSAIIRIRIIWRTRQVPSPVATSNYILYHSHLGSPPPICCGTMSSAVSNQDDDNDNDNNNDDNRLVADAPPSTPPTTTAAHTTAHTTNKRPRLPWLGSFLRRYTAAVGQSVHQDRLLKTLQYTLWWYAQLAPAKPQAATTLATQVSWARFVTRLTDWPTALEAVWNDSWISLHDDDDDNAGGALTRLGRGCGRLLAWSMLVYYPAEHMALLQWQLPTSLGRIQRVAERASAWSCRAWLVYLLTDIFQSTLALRQQQQQQQARRRRRRQLEATHQEDPDKGNDHACRPAKLQVVALARNALFVLPALHWSLPQWDRQPWLKSTTVNTFMWMEALLSLYQTSLEVE